MSWIVVKMVRVRNKEIGLQQVSLSYPSQLEILGESASAERQVSPEKLYRAALLKNRFADTILKAREKTLGQVGLFDGVCVGQTD